MKARLLFTILLIIGTGVVFASSALDQITDTRTASGFYGVVINTPANVILTQGDVPSVKLEGEKQVISAITTNVQNGALVINGNNNRPVNIYITVSDLSLVEVNGSARVYANGVINSDILLLKVNGTGSIRMDVRTLTIGMVVKGSGKIITSGSTGESFSKVYGSGNIYCSNLDAYSVSRTTQPEQAALRNRLSLHQ